MTMKLTTTGFLLVLLVAACDSSDDDSGGGVGGSGTSRAGTSGSLDAAGDGPTTSGGQSNAAGRPSGSGDASNSGSDGMIQALHAALGNSAIALQGTDTAFWPEAATDENDEWLVTVLGAYDGVVDDGAASGHYLVTQPTDASLDFELEAATSGAPYRAFVGPSWLTIFLQQTGAAGFRVDVTCRDVEVDAMGTGAAAVVVGQNTNDTTSGSLFCIAAAGESDEPFSQPTTSFEIEADADGYAVMPYFEVTVLTATFAEGDSASSKAKVHMEFTALN